MRISDWSSDVCSSDLVPDIQPVEQMLVLPHRFLPPEVSDAHCMRQGDIVKRIGAGSRYRSRHIGNAIVHNAVDQISGLIVRCEIGRASCRERLWQYV